MIAALVFPKTTIRQRKAHTAKEFESQDGEPVSNGKAIKVLDQEMIFCRARMRVWKRVIEAKSKIALVLMIRDAEY